MMPCSTGPLVSVITPTLDADAYLDECICSVLAQNHRWIEHVFVDGGSTDCTLAMLRDYDRRYPGRIRILVEPGTSAGEAWNRGVKASRGTILTCLGADDISTPGAVEAVVAFFDAHQEASFVHGGCDIIDVTGALIHRHRVEPFDLQAFLDTARHIATPSAYYRRELLERIGWLDNSGDDFDVMIRLATHAKVHGLDRVLSKLRMKPNSAFNRTVLAERLPQMRDTYRVSRRHGGSRFSRLAMRYYLYSLLGRLRLDAGYRLLRAWRARQNAGAHETRRNDDGRTPTELGPGHLD